MQVAAVLVLALAALVTASSPLQYNVEWTTATKEPGTTQGGVPTYQGSMPIGNGKLTAQTWANVSAGGIGLYVGHQVRLLWCIAGSETTGDGVCMCVQYL